jgi:hypothetical protein
LENKESKKASRRVEVFIFIVVGLFFQLGLSGLNVKNRFVIIIGWGLASVVAQLLARVANRMV